MTNLGNEAKITMKSARQTFRKLNNPNPKTQNP